MDKLLCLCVLVTFFMSHVDGLRRYRAIPPKNQCSLHHNGCQYDFVLNTANCDPRETDEEGRNRWARELPVLQEQEMELDGEQVSIVRGS